MKKKTYRIMFVCLGNICRSPFAEVVLREIAHRMVPELKIESDSSGLIAYHIGNSADSRMIACAKKKNYQINTKAKQYRREKHFARFDLILAMDTSVLQSLKKTLLPGEDLRKIRLFTEFCAPPDNSGIADPYYGGINGFDLASDRIENGCCGILSFLQKEVAVD